MRMYRGNQADRAEVPDHADRRRTRRRAARGAGGLHHTEHDAERSLGRPEKAVIGITEGLLRRLTPDELAGVLAHEISHVRNNDLAVMGLADVMTRFTQMLSYLALFLAFFHLPRILAGEGDLSLMGLLILYLAPSIGSLLQLGLSRTREYDAVSGTGPAHPAAVAATLAPDHRGTRRAPARCGGPPDAVADRGGAGDVRRTRRRRRAAAPHPLAGGLVLSLAYPPSGLSRQPP